jgi:hypothetical protein
MPRGIRGSGTRARRTLAVTSPSALSNNAVIKLQAIWQDTNALKGQVSDQYLTQFNRLIGEMVASVFTGRSATASPTRGRRTTPAVTVVSMPQQRRRRTSAARRGRPPKQQLQATGT